MCIHSCMTIDNKTSRLHNHENNIFSRAQWHARKYRIFGPYLVSNSLISKSSFPHVSVHWTFLRSTLDLKVCTSSTDSRGSSPSLTTIRCSKESLLELLLRQPRLSLPLMEPLVVNVLFAEQDASSCEVPIPPGALLEAALGGDATSRPFAVHPKQTKGAHFPGAWSLAAEGRWYTCSVSRSTSRYWFHGETLTGFSSAFRPSSKRARPWLYPEAEDEKNPPPSTASSISTAHPGTMN